MERPLGSRTSLQRPLDTRSGLVQLTEEFPGAHQPRHKVGTQGLADACWNIALCYTQQRSSCAEARSEADFVAQLMKWMSLSADEVMKAVVTNMDRSA